MYRLAACFFAVALILGAGHALAAGYGYNSDDVHVNGYSRQDGTYVQPHYRSAPDGNPYNNYGSRPSSQPSYSSPYGQPSQGNAPWPALGNPGGRPSHDGGRGSMLR